MITRLITLFLLLSPLRSFALAEVISPVDGLPNPDGPGTDFLASLIAYMIGVVAILAVIGVTWGGIQLVLATGDDEKIKKGRYTIIYSLIGVLVAGVAYGIVSLVGSLQI